MTAPAPATPDPWVPAPLRVAAVHRETADVTTLVLDTRAAPWSFRPGQFNMLFRPGMGEAAISISGDPTRPDRLVHTIRAVGPLTRHLVALAPGDVLGVRGPFGSAWPVDLAEGQDVVIVAGGIGLAPLRPAIHHVLHHRRRYGRVRILYGARQPADLLYLGQLHRWRGRFDIDLDVIVDRPDADWNGPVGVVTRLFADARLDPDDTVAMTCGPEIMMRFVVTELANQGLSHDRIFLSMERSMRCAVGLCGHCQWGPTLVCRDGPVYRFSDIRRWFAVRGL